jgi:hypothetical protein
MDREVNIDAIRVLERRIEDGEGNTIQLKRTRNSLLNISRVPPEVLGDVFIWRVVRGEDHSLGTNSHFNGVQKGSYAFLLVCHHWFEVATGTPELWNFWGNTLREWKNRHPHDPGVAPLDLVLHGHLSRDDGAIVDEPLQCALRSRALQDTIRQFHLFGYRNIAQPVVPRILQPIISSLTSDSEGVRYSSIESIDLRHPEASSLDVSDFFTRYRLPKLRSLFLHGTFIVPPWDRLVPHTTLLTTLSLNIDEPSLASPPTTSQLLSILASNPNLQELSMTRSMIPEDDDGSIFQVPMRNLRVLELAGELRPMFRLLDRLAFPGTLDRIFLSALDSTVEDVLQISGPYLRGYFRRDHRLPNRLGVSVSASRCLAISVDIINNNNPRVSHERWVDFTAILRGAASPDVLDNLCLDFIAFTPQNRVSQLQLSTNRPLTNRMNNLLIAMPNIETLYLLKVALSKGFLQPDTNGPQASRKLLPSLRHLDLLDIILPDGDWGHLKAYLAHQTSDNQVISFIASGSSHMCPEVMSEMESFVEEFCYDERPKDKRVGYGGSEEN